MKITLITFLAVFYSTKCLQVFHRNSFETQEYSTSSHPKTFSEQCHYINKNEFHIQFDFWIKLTDQPQNATILCVFTHTKKLLFSVEVSLSTDNITIKKEKDAVSLIIPESIVQTVWNHFNLQVSQTKHFENDIDLLTICHLNGVEVVNSQNKISNFLAENQEYKIQVCSKDYYYHFCER